MYYGYEMKHDKSYLKAKNAFKQAFDCNFRKEGADVWCRLHIGLQSIEFKLTKTQFKNLKTFLKKTLAPQSSFNKELGVARFDMIQNHTSYFNLEWMKRRYKSYPANELKKVVADVKKHKLTKTIDLIVNDVWITLLRENFCILRESILDPKGRIEKVAREALRRLAK